MHNIANSVKFVGGTRHFPRMISKLLGPKFLDVSLSRDPIIAYIQPFTASSFHKKWLNTFTDGPNESNQFLQE